MLLSHIDVSLSLPLSLKAILKMPSGEDKKILLTHVYTEEYTHTMLTWNHHLSINGRMNKVWLTHVMAVNMKEPEIIFKNTNM